MSEPDPAAPADLRLRDVVAALEALYPPDTAQDWDRVGLVTGDLDQPVRRVHLAVDPTLAVVQEAVDAGADLLVTHHPLLLRGIHSVATTSAKGETLTRAILGDLAVYCAHTNADVATRACATRSLEAVGLQDVEPLEAGEHALGRVGRLPAPMSLQEFAARVAAGLPATVGGLRVAGDPDATVERVAVLGGSGDDRFDVVRASGADVYVTADLRHHPVLEERETSRGATALPRRRRTLGHRMGVAGLRRRPAPRGAGVGRGRRVVYVGHLRLDVADRAVDVRRRRQRGAPPVLIPEVPAESRPDPSTRPARPAGGRLAARPDRARDVDVAPAP